MDQAKINGKDLDAWKEEYLSCPEDDAKPVLREAERPGSANRETSGSLHENHRERLRERFMRENGFEHFTDHQVLELLLFYANPRSDTNPIAHALLDEFGSLKAVLEARPEMLQTVKGVGPQAATLISMVVPLTRIWSRCAMQTPRRVGNSREAEKYCVSILAGLRTERFYVVALNAQCNILGQRKISEGSLSEVSAYPRMVMETALNYKTVEPGFGGQKLDESVLEKMRVLRREGYAGLIEADGGLREDNLQRLIDSGLDVAVMGTALFRAEDMAGAIRRIHGMTREASV